MYRCEICGVAFYEPERRERNENLDGENGWERREELVCPVCGEPYFHKEDEDAKEI